MKFLFQILIFLFTCYTSSALPIAIGTAPKIVVPTNTSIFQETELVIQSEKAKIGVQQNARSSIEEQQAQTYTFHQNTFLLSSYLKEENTCALDYQELGSASQILVAEFSKKETLSLLENRAREVLEEFVSGAGNLWTTFLDDAFTLQKRAEVIASGLPAQFPNLTIDELTAIKVYTSDQMRNGSKIYQTLNTELRAGNLSDYNKGLNDLLNNGLNKLPQHNGNVFRGVYGQEATIAKTWNIGDEIPFKDFKSSSINRQTAAYEFSYNKGENVVYEIIGGKGSNVCGISCIPNEMEVR